MDFNLSQLSLFPATPAQVDKSRRNQHSEWGRGSSPEYYLKLKELVDVHEHATEDKYITWVLAPRDDPETLDFLCSCATFRRRALVHYASSQEVEERVAYAVSVVFCPPENRKKGYASHMMRLLHYMLAPPGSIGPFPSSWGLPPVAPPTAGNGLFSVLYSAIGHSFYASLGPDPTRLGWQAKDQIDTIWSTKQLSLHPASIRWLSIDGCIKLWHEDASYMRERILATSESSTPPVRCAFLPSHGVAAYQIHRVNFFLPCLPDVQIPQKWGVIIPGTAEPTYATWITDVRSPPAALVITRIRATPENFPVLLSAIMDAAQENACITVEVWNLDGDLRQVARELGGHTKPRLNQLTSLAWYGPGKVEDVDFLFDENGMRGNCLTGVVACRSYAWLIQLSVQ
ncbi:hypothetical protein BU17DRAFT_76228 [Hysterangium stoloniferum]|nr:hypothetical protein BU17DRAFT_76228 [Hysterangium stoloniferum]